MENATQALIMAATILISVVIVSLAVYLFATFGSYSAQVDEDTRNNQISQFNSQFLKYQGQVVTIYDIITVANLAKENNENYDLTQNDANENTLYVTVNIPGVDSHFESNVDTFIQNKNNSMQEQSYTKGELMAIPGLDADKIRKIRGQS